MPDAQKPARRPAAPPAPARPRPIREVLQQAANTHIVEMAQQGFKDIDAVAEKGKRHLRQNGVHGFDEILDTGATLIKQLFARGISKR